MQEKANLFAVEAGCSVEGYSMSSGRLFTDREKAFGWVREQREDGCLQDYQVVEMVPGDDGWEPGNVWDA